MQHTPCLTPDRLDAEANDSALAPSVDTKAEARLVGDLWALLDKLHDALRAAYTDHVVYPTKDTPATYQRAQSLHGAMFRFCVNRGLLLSRAEALQDPADLKALAKIDARFGALLDTHPMPPLSTPDSQAIH